MKTSTVCSLLLFLWCIFLPPTTQADSLDYAEIYLNGNILGKWWQGQPAVQIVLTFEKDSDSLSVYPFTDTGGNRYAKVLMLDSSYNLVATLERQGRQDYGFQYVTPPGFFASCKNYCSYTIVITFPHAEATYRSPCFELVVQRKNKH